MEPTFMMCVKCQRRLGKIFQRSFSLHNQSVLQRNYYEVLGVKRNASPSDVKTAYINLSKTLHPDVNPSNRGQHYSFVELNHAYAILSKSVTRREYDISLTNPRPVGHRVRTATADDPYGTQHTQHDRYHEMYTYHRGTYNSGSSDNYYGIKGIHRVSSLYILYGCLAFICAGALIHYVIFKHSSSYALKRLDEKDRRISITYNEAKARAQQNGNKKQIELLRARQEEFNVKMKELNGET